MTIQSASAESSAEFGRDQADWDVLAEVGETFLIERARLGKLTSYTEMNAALVNRTGLRAFDFASQADRAAMGHLLFLTVQRNRPVTGLMISALVSYLDANDAGTGFYRLAQQLDELPPGRLSQDMRDLFWSRQVRNLHEYYGKGGGTA